MAEQTEVTREDAERERLKAAVREALDRKPQPAPVGVQKILDEMGAATAGASADQISAWRRRLMELCNWTDVS